MNRTTTTINPPPSRLRLSALLLTVSLALCIPTLPACEYRAGGTQSVEKTLYELRSQNADLMARIEALEQDAVNRRAQIDTLEKRLAGDTTQVPGVSPADIPRVVRIDLDKLSHAKDTDNDGRFESVVLYVQTLDQRGRFMPAVGQAVVTVSTTSGEQTQPLTTQSFTPAEFDAAFRTGLTGSHHTLRVELPEPTDQPLQIRIVFTDGATGVTVELDGPLDDDN